MTRFVVALSALSALAVVLGGGEVRWGGVTGLGIAFALLAWAVWRAVARRAARNTLGVLRALPPGDFESEVARWFQHAGWKVEHSGGTGDGGIDLVACRRGETVVIQCKRYAEHAAVSAAQVRDLYGAAVARGATGAVLVTTGRVSKAARSWTADLPEGPSVAFHDLECVPRLARGSHCCSRGTD